MKGLDFVSEKKRMPDYQMELNIENRKIDLAVFVDPNFKGLRYELTSQEEIEPLDALFCLWLLIKGGCDQHGINPESLIKNYSNLEAPEDETKH